MKILGISGTSWLLGVSIFLNILSLSLILWLHNSSSDARDWQPIEASMSVLQVFLIVVALGGFWLVYNTARAQAEATADAVARKTARKAAVTTARRAAEDWLASRDPIDPQDVSDQTKAFGEEDDDGER